MVSSVRQENKVPLDENLTRGIQKLDRFYYKECAFKELFVFCELTHIVLDLQKWGQLLEKKVSLNLKAIGYSKSLQNKMFSKK